MRISDWSSDVCSSDLLGTEGRLHHQHADPRGRQAPERARLAGGGGLRGGRLVQTGLAIMAAAAAVPGAGGAAVDLGRGLDEVLDARRLPLGPGRLRRHAQLPRPARRPARARAARSEEHTSELQSLMRISYAVFCLKK